MVRVIPPPDSLVHLTLKERGGEVLIRSNRSFEEIQQFWSARFRTFFSQSQEPFPQPFATLWSRELALAEAAHAARENTPQSPSEEKKTSEKREDKPPLHQSISRSKLERLFGKERKALRFAVYLFSKEDLPVKRRLDFMRTRVWLEDEGDNEYRPDSIVVGPVVRTNEVPGAKWYYRRSTVYFDRSALEEALDKPSRLWLRVKSEKLHFLEKFVFRWRIAPQRRLSERWALRLHCHWSDTDA